MGKAKDGRTVSAVTCILGTSKLKELNLCVGLPSVLDPCTTQHARQMLRLPVSIKSSQTMQQVFRNARRISVNVLMIVKDQKSMFKIIQLSG